MRRKMIREGRTHQDGASILPFSFGWQEGIVLAFFVIQYIVLAVIQYT